MPSHAGRSGDSFDKCMLSQTDRKPNSTNNRNNTFTEAPLPPRVSQFTGVEVSPGVSGSSVVLGSLGAYDLQSLVAEGSRATISNSDNIELANDIYSKYAKPNSVKHIRTWISYFTRARPPNIQTFPIASSAHDSATSVPQGSSHATVPEFTEDLNRPPGVLKYSSTN